MHIHVLDLWPGLRLASHLLCKAPSNNVCCRTWLQSCHFFGIIFWFVCGWVVALHDPRLRIWGGVLRSGDLRSLWCTLFFVPVLAVWEIGVMGRARALAITNPNVTCNSVDVLVREFWENGSHGSRLPPWCQQCLEVGICCCVRVSDCSARFVMLVWICIGIAML